MTPYVLRNGHMGDAQAKISDLFTEVHELERELASERALHDEAERDLYELKAVLTDSSEVELAMIRGDIAIPDRVEFDGIRETKNQPETDDDQARDPA